MVPLSEKNQFDFTLSAIVILATAWTGCEMDPDGSSSGVASLELFHPP